MTGEFDGVYSTIYRTGHLSDDITNDENDSAAPRLSVILTRTSPVRIFWGQEILSG
jgi:hypothetical protein